MEDDVNKGLAVKVDCKSLINFNIISCQYCTDVSYNKKKILRQLTVDNIEILEFNIKYYVK